MQTTTRNASLSDLAAMLQDQHARKLDLVVPSSKLAASGGALIVEGAEPIIDDDGVTPVDGRYVPTVVCDEGVADKLGIPVAYLKRTRETRPDIFDANVNGWLHGDGENVDADPRSFLVRCFRGDDGGDGIARAFLSDRYGIIDDLDVLTALLEGIRESGVETEIVGCDLTDRRMRIRVAAPAIAELAPDLLRGYRSPFTGDEGSENPVVFAGFEASNSEVGGGAFSIVPRLVVQVCTNGMKITKDAMREIHLGGRLDEGVIRWTEDTQRKALELVTAKARDAVSTFLDLNYVRTVLLDVEDKASEPIRGDSVQVVTTVCKQLRFSEERTAGVLDHFIRGGQITAGGVMHAVTSFAQTIDDADDAADVEAAGLPALDLALAVAR